MVNAIEEGSGLPVHIPSMKTCLTRRERNKNKIMFEDFINRYIGPKQIKGVALSNRKTYIGKEVLEIEYEDGTKEEFPKEMVEKIVTKEKSDLTSLRDASVKPVVEKMIAVMLEAEIQIVDIEFALAQTSNSLNVHLEKANELLWKKDLMKRNLADIQKILTQKQNQNELQKRNQKSKRGNIPENIPDPKRDR